MEKEYKDKKGLKRNRILVTILLTALLLYMMYVIYLLIKQPTDTFTVEKGTLYLEENAEGYILRDEKVVQGKNYKNGMEQIITEGEKAAKNEAIFRYYSNNEANLKKKIEELDKKIQEASAKSDKVVPSSDIKAIEQQIDEKIKELSTLTDFSTIDQCKKDIEDLVLKKSKIAGELSPSGSHMKKLIKERSKYENQLNSGSEYVKAPSSGVVSYKVDGLESTLLTKDFSYLSKEYLEGLDLKAGKTIATNEECGKVINNFSCYIATVLNSNKAKEAEIEDKVTVELSNGEKLDAKVAYTKQEENGNVLVILEVNRLTEDLINYRKISFNLIWWSYSGLKVPNQAIVEKDNLQYVVRSRAGYLDKLLVKVLRQNDDYSIVTTYTTDELKELGYTTQEILSNKKITVYDEILINPNLENVN